MDNHCGNTMDGNHAVDLSLPEKRVHCVDDELEPSAESNIEPPSKRYKTEGNPFSPPISDVEFSNTPSRMSLTDQDISGGPVAPDKQLIYPALLGYTGTGLQIPTPSGSDSTVRESYNGSGNIQQLRNNFPTFGTAGFSDSIGGLFTIDSNLPQAMSFTDPEKTRHLSLSNPSLTKSTTRGENDAEFQEIITAPLFSREVKNATVNDDVNSSPFARPRFFPQYGYLGIRQETYGAYAHEEDLIDTGSLTEVDDEDMIYTNMNAPWSVFICGSQGGGKSHTLSCLLENSLLSSSEAGKLPNPLTGIVFHYDKFTSHTSTQLCEAAYLCSSGVPVRVLVSPSNIWAMTKLYSNLPGLPPGAPRPKVVPLYFKEEQLNIANMMTLMAVSDTERMPLYLEVLFQVLRKMAMENRGAPGLNYNRFKARLSASGFTRQQTGPLSLRLQLLESFMDPASMRRAGVPSMSKDDIWKFQKGSLTIIDLSCPFVNENDACALFSICLSLFLEHRSEGARLVALDEAHKFLTQSGEAQDFTNQLVSIICQQRHLATRVMIATQEPTLSPRLLDLCNVSIVHRFLSPAWYETLKRHLAGAGRGGRASHNSRLFQTIVALKTGQALVFAPTAMLDVDGRGQIQPLGDKFFRIRIRKRLTADGGQSIMASDKSNPSQTSVDVPIQELQAEWAMKNSQEAGIPLGPRRSVRLQAGTQLTLAPSAHVPARVVLSQATPQTAPLATITNINAPAPVPALQGHNIQVSGDQITRALQQETLKRMVRGKPNAMILNSKFEVIRDAVSQTLGLDIQFFSSAGDDGWKKKSKKIIHDQIYNQETVWQRSTRK